MEFKSYHKDHDFLHVGCEEPRAYFIPYESEEKALENNRDDSEYLLNLCGDWNFRFYESFEDLEDDFLSLPFKEKMLVPSSWQNCTEKGYDAPQYLNSNYPYPLDMPHIPDENPCALYSKDVILPENFEGKKIYINFEGVDSCFYLFVNNEFAGYSQVSHCTSELNITEYLKAGKNKIDVLVVKWCDGSYLEDQDYFRLSGIFREVYLLARQENHLKDIYVRQDVSESLKYATIKFETDKCVKFTLTSPDGETVISGTTDEDVILENPVLWNAENPQLYTLIIEDGCEFIPFKIGLKRLEIKGAIMYLNNEKVKLYGINRHDTHPVLGHATPVEHMKEDLYILKRASCNCIRTSHYPNDPRFLEYCDEMGFMVIDEADIETHGMGFEYRNDWDWMRWSMLSTVDEWEASYVDRAKRLFERDKNHGCVVMWSLGNESGCGKNHRAMNKYIKSREPKAIIHYENAHLEFKAVPEGEDFKDISDVESRMYAPLDYTKNYLEQENIPKPFYFCEYVCSLTTGDIHAHVDLMEKYDELCGMCIWEMTDHAVAVKGKYKDVGYRYGSDFGDIPNDKLCCIDGLVFADRKLRPGYFEMKKAYEPFKITYENGKINIFNKRFFTTLGDVYFTWSVEKEGKVILSGEISDTDIAPRGEKEFKLFDIKDFDGITMLNIFCKMKEATYWCEKDYEIGFYQEVLSFERKEAVTSIYAPEFEDAKRFVKITADRAVYTFDKAYGRLASIVAEGKELLASPEKIQIWKAHAHNQDGIRDERKSASMEMARQKTYSSVISTTENSVIITVDFSLGGASVVPVIRGKKVYEFAGDGTVKISVDADKRESAPQLARFGLEFMLTDGMENMEYFGFGPTESYPDRHKACYKAHFKSTVTENFVNYVKPIENSAHYESIFGAVTDNDGKGLIFVADDNFSFNASHFTTDILEKTLHDDELIPLSQTVVNIDLKHDILGAKADYNFDFEPERKWDDNKLVFSFRVSPFDKNSDNPFEM